VLDGSGWLMSSQLLYPQERGVVPIVQEAGWTPGLVRMGTENLYPAWLLTPDCPNISESLYQLWYPICHTYIHIYYFLPHPYFNILFAVVEGTIVLHGIGCSEL